VDGEVSPLSAVTAGSPSPACVVRGLRVTAASVTFDAATSPDAKERGKDTVMEVRVVVTGCKGSDAGTTRCSMGGDDEGMARRSKGGDRGPATSARRRKTRDDIRRGCMRRTADDD